MNHFHQKCYDCFQLIRFTSITCDVEFQRFCALNSNVDTRNNDCSVNVLNPTTKKSKFQFRIIIHQVKFNLATHK